MPTRPTMLARAYGSVGTKRSLLQEWATEELTNNLTSVGNDRGGAIAISNALGRVQTCDVDGKPRGSALGTKGRTPGEFMAPCQTCLSADSTVLAVADSGNNRVQLFDAATRKYLASVGRKGQIRPGRMQAPEGVTFVDGRREMIVADTGNNRLQVFHVNELAAAPVAAPSRRGNAAVRGVNSAPRAGGMPLDSSANATDNTQSSSSGSLVNWAQSQAPVPSQKTKEADAGNGGDKHRATAAPRQSRESERQGNTAALEGDESENQSNGGCLLVFNGGEGAGSIVKRRTVGESEAGEGALSQPCDVAYWRARPKEDAAVLWAWTPDIPPWFRRCTGDGSSGGGGGERGGGGFSPAGADEAVLRGELLSPLLPSGVSPDLLKKSAPGVHFSGERKQSDQPLSERWRKKEVKVGRGRKESSPSGTDSDAGGGGGGGGGGAGEGPKAGAFVVRETGVPGKLQLLFVAKTKEAEDLDVAKEARKKDAGSVSSLSQDGSEGPGGAQQWTKSRGSAESIFTATPKDGRGKEPNGTVDREEREGYDTASSTATPSAQAPALEVRGEPITVLGQGEGVEICGRAYGCLLSLLRAFRGRGFASLVGAADTRGERGIVAVAERAGGRVRLLHYAPALPPFYRAELTHLHSIEGLRRPNSVSFSPEGDLLIAEKAGRKVTVYACLSGVWTHVHDFGPEGGKSFRDGTLIGGNARSPASSHLASHPGGWKACNRARERPNHRTGNTTDHKNTFPEEPGGWGDGGQGSTAIGPEPIVENSSGGSEDEKKEGREEGRKEEEEEEEEEDDDDEDTREWIEWAQGVPVSARFVSSKATERGASTVAVRDSDAHDATNARDVAIVVGCSDGTVRAMAGPAKRNCGSFAGLHTDTALFIVELLGYRSSQVLACVNRTMSSIRKRLRREWRLHPLTPGALAKATLEFLQWGRFTTGEGLPGRGSSIDAAGRKLCDQFLATSACARPACPYSHEQPWIDPACASNEQACILFRGGVVHAVTNLYGQIFAWEWEGDLYRLFRDRSSLRAIVARRDPMTLGIYGAEAIRDCVEEEHHVLNYSGFVDFATAVHEHVIGLRPWHPRVASRPTSARGTPPTTTAPVLSGGKEVSSSSAGGGGGGGGGGCAPRHTPAEVGSEYLLLPPRVRLGGEEKSANGTKPGGDGVDGGGGGGGAGRGERGGGGGGGERERYSDEAVREFIGQTASEKETTPLPAPRRLVDKKSVIQSGDCTGLRKAQPRHSPPSGHRKLDPAVPWLGWDTPGAVSDTAVGTVSVSRDVGDGNPRGEGKRGVEMEEEPEVNRRYGTTVGEREASVNKLIAFQTDRVVRMLDRMF